MAGIPKPKRGGGPKTEAGKLASSNNALKTGAYSSQLTLPGESEADFKHLEEQLVRDFSPKDMAERILVHDLSVITWKKLRLDGVEHAVMMAAINKPVTLNDLRREGISLDYDYEPLIKNMSIYTDDFIAENRAHLDFLSRFLEHPIGKEEFYELPKTHPELYRTLVDLARAEFNFTEVSPLPEQIGMLNFKDDTHRNHSFVHYIFPIIYEQSKKIAFIAELIDEIRSAVATIRERALLELIQQPSIVRAGEDLSRAFSRTLNELRRQQQWRVKMAVEVSSEE
jgi:hypothetical protein